MVAKLSEEQKTEFFHQGYLVLKDVVPIKLVEEARARIKRAKKGESLAAAEELASVAGRNPDVVRLKVLNRLAVWAAASLRLVLRSKRLRPLTYTGSTRALRQGPG